MNTDPGIPSIARATDLFGRQHGRSIDVLLDGKPIAETVTFCCFAYDAVAGHVDGYLRTPDGGFAIDPATWSVARERRFGRVEVRWKNTPSPLLDRVVTAGQP